MADKDISVSLKLDDEYTAKTSEAAAATDKLAQSQDKAGDASLRANVKFLATVQGLERMSGGVKKVSSGLQNMGLISDETREQIRKFEGGMDVLVGSMQVAITTTKFWREATNAQKTALVGLGFAAAAAASAYAAMNAQSNEQRALFSLLTGVTSGLAIAQFTLALASYSAAVAAAGPAAPIMAAIIGGSLIAATTYWVSTKNAAEAQTGMDEVKVVRASTSGSFEIHAGEEAIVRRPSIGDSGSFGSPLVKPSTGDSGSFGSPSVQISQTFIGWFAPSDPRGQANISEATAQEIVRRLGGRR